MSDRQSICQQCGMTFPEAAVDGLCPRCVLDGAFFDMPSIKSLSGGMLDDGVVPGHRMEQIIGRGGMGVVFRARQENLERDVAVKVLAHGSLDPEQAQRFTREATVLAQLEHPNIVPIHEMGLDEEGQIFYTMKLVKGRTLQAVLKDLGSGDAETVKDFPLDRLLSVFRKVCDAISFAHSRGVLHRDLKPENVMVGEFGEVLVMDWGLAKRMGTDEDSRTEDGDLPPEPGFGKTGSATLDGAVMGTPHYMSPEQAAGQVSELDARSDVYSLGGILYAILTLRAPVEGSTVPEVLANVKSGRITPPSGHTAVSGKNAAQERPAMSARHSGELPHLPGGRVPQALSLVAMKSLQVDRGKRYAEASALAADIDAYSRGFATSAEHAGTLRQLKLLMLRHKAMTASLAVLLLVSIVFVVKLIQSERRAVRNEGAALSEKETGRQSLARSRISLAEAAYRENNSRAMMSELEQVPEDLRDSDWRYLYQRADTSRARIGEETDRKFMGVAAHPQQRGVFALASTDGMVAIYDATEHRVLRQFRLSERQRPSMNFRGLAWSPDGSRIIVSGLGSAPVAIYTAEGQLLIEWEAKETERVAFSPDGARVFHISTGQRIFVRLAETGKLLWSLDNCKRAAYMPSGEIMTARGSRLQLVAGDSGEVIRTVAELPATIWALEVSPDGAMIYAGSGDCVVRALRVRDAKLMFDGRLNERGGAMKLSLGGRRLVGAVMDGQFNVRAVKVWDALTGAHLDTLLGGWGFVEGVAAHPLGGEVIVTGSSHNRLWNLLVRAPRWMVDDIRTTGRFWMADDLFIPRSEPVKLLDDGSISGPIWTPPEGPFDFASLATDGALAVIGSRYGPRARAHVLWKRDGRIAPGPVLETRCGELAFVQANAAGGRVATCDSYNTLEVFDAVTGKSLPRPDTAGLRCITGLGWAGPEQLIGIGYAGGRGEPETRDSILVWNTTTGQILRRAQGVSVAVSLAVSPDGRTFAEGGEDKRIRVHDAGSLAVLHEFRAHDSPVEQLAFHPSQPVLASSSATESKVRLWRMPEGTLLDEIYTSGRPRSIHFSPSGSRLAISGDIWDLASPAEGIASSAGHTEKRMRDLKAAEVPAPATSAAEDEAKMAGLTAASRHVLQVRGNGSMDTPGPLLPVDGDFTVECRVFALEPKLDTYRHFVAQNRQFYMGTAPDGTIRLGDSWLKTDFRFPFGSWHQLAFVKDAKGAAFYIDGRFSGRSPAPLRRPSSDSMQSAFALGRQWESPPCEQWIGCVDDVRVWNRALTADEIKAGLNTALTGQEAGLIGLYDFEDGTARDRSPRRHHGTLKGDARIVETVQSGEK